MPLHNWDKMGSKYGLLKLFKKFLNRLFAEMLLDSEIAKNFQCGSTKVSFVTVCILAPFLHSFLLQITQFRKDQWIRWYVILVKIWIECVPVTWNLNLWHDQPLSMYLRSFRTGFLRLMSQRLCKSHLMDLMSTLQFWKNISPWWKKNN